MKVPLKNGQEFERLVSAHLHRDRPAILISPKLLRARAMGQVDLAFFNGKKAFIAECKYGKGKVSRVQLSRLLKTKYFIQGILSTEVELIGIQQVAKLQDGEYPFKVCNIRELM